MSKIGIVTVLYNSESVLEEFFETLGQQTERNFTLYLVDNASKDKSLELAKQLAEKAWFPCVFFPENENWGVAKGNNIGIKSALNDGSEYVLLSNNDIVLRPDTIENLLLGLHKMNADMAVPKIYYHDTNLLWFAGGEFRKLLGSTRHIGIKEVDEGQYNACIKISYAPTCFMFLKRDVFDKIGLMDEKYFVYYDDTDFVCRANKRGLGLYYIPSSILFHKVSTCTSGTSDFTINMMSRNSIYYVRKNYKFPLKQLAICNIIFHSSIWTLIRKSLREAIKRTKGNLKGFKIPC